jgi:hypothetical protein
MGKRKKKRKLLGDQTIPELRETIRELKRYYRHERSVLDDVHWEDQRTIERLRGLAEERRLSQVKMIYEIRRHKRTIARLKSEIIITKEYYGELSFLPSVHSPKGGN